MKKVIIFFAVLVMALSNSMTVYAAHTHTDNCYTIQGAHTHSGNAVNGGSCYGTPIYHIHTGDTRNGGGCYGTPVYHVHEGKANQSAQNGCYTNQSVSTRTCNVTATLGAGSAGTNSCINAGTTCPGAQACTLRGWTVTHSSCGKAIDYGSHGYSTCNNCGSIVYTWGSGATNPIGTHFIPSATHEYNITVYDLGCGKTEQTVERYELNCGKSTDTIEGYSLSCGQQESTGTKVLICSIPESVDTQTSTPASVTEPVSDKQVEQSETEDEPEKKTEKKNEESEKNNTEENVDEEEEQEPVVTLPEELPEEAYIISEPDDTEVQELIEPEPIVEIEDEMTPKAQFQVAAAVAGTTTVTGGMIWVVFCFVRRKCKIIDTITEEVLGTAHIIKRRKFYVVNISDKIYEACDKQITLDFGEKFVRKNMGTKLVVNIGEYEYQKRIDELVNIMIEEN